MRVLSVDLAAKMSAFCMLEYDEILQQGHSWGSSEDTFVDSLVGIATIFRPDHILLEDLPHGVKFMGITKAVCRLQGRIGDRLFHARLRDRALFVPPTTWKAHYGLNGKGSAERVLPAAEALGYVPPLDYTTYHGPDRTAARKARTDYAAAYLLGRWGQLQDFEVENPSCSRYL